MKKLVLCLAIVLLAWSQGIEDLLFEEIPVVFAASKFEQPLIEVPASVITEKLFFTVETRYVEERLDVWLEPVDPYLSTNVTLFAKELIPHIELTAKVWNVLDEEYYDPCSGEHEQSSILQDGRTFQVKLTLKT